LKHRKFVASSLEQYDTAPDHPLMATLFSFHSDSASIGGDLSVTKARGGTIGGNALLNFSVTHDITVQGADTTNQGAAIWQILNDDGPVTNPDGSQVLGVHRWDDHGNAALLLSAANLAVAGS
jgi:hypothetical protein